MEVLNYYQMETAAKLCGMTGDCVRQAVRRGLIPFVTTLDAVHLVRLEDVQDYKKNRRPRGRPRKEER